MVFDNKSGNQEATMENHNFRDYDKDTKQDRKLGRFCKFNKLLKALSLTGMMLLLSTCENNLLEILGRDVFFATVVDPFSIAIDFEYVGQMEVSGRHPILVQVIPINQDGGVTINELELSQTFNSNITSSRQKLIITSDFLNSFGEMINNFMVIFHHLVHADIRFERNPGGSPDDSLVKDNNIPGFSENYDVFGARTPNIITFYDSSKPGNFSYDLISAIVPGTQVVDSSRVLSRGSNHSIRYREPEIRFDPLEQYDRFFSNNRNYEDYPELHITSVESTDPIVRSLGWRDEDVFLFKFDNEDESEDLFDIKFIIHPFELDTDYPWDGEYYPNFRRHVTLKIRIEKIDGSLDNTPEVFIFTSREEFSINETYANNTFNPDKFLVNVIGEDEPIEWRFDVGFNEAWAPVVINSLPEGEYAITIRAFTDDDKKPYASSVVVDYVLNHFEIVSP